MTTPTLGVAIGGPPSVYTELAGAVAQAARDMGRNVRRVADAYTGRELDFVLGVGYVIGVPARPMAT